MTAEELATSHRRKAMLEKKAALYDQLKRGDSAGLSEAQRSSLGVDFEKKLEQEWDALQNGTQGEESEEGESDSSQESDDEQPVRDIPLFLSKG